MTPRKQLLNFLRISFSADELRSFLSFGPSGKEITADLPGPTASLSALTTAAIDALDRWQLIDDSLFRRLCKERPYCSKEIESVAALFRDEWQEHERTKVKCYNLTLVEDLEKINIKRESLDSRAPEFARLTKRATELSHILQSDIRYEAGAEVAGTILEEIIGIGNFGTVWRSRTQDGKPMATKCFHLSKLTDGVMLWSFRRSLNAMARMGRKSAPASLPRIYMAAADSLAFSMPLCRHGDLSGIAKHQWSMKTKVEKFSAVCRAVAFSHDMGIIHRDIKPSNVLLDDDLKPVLIDFDIAEIRFVTELDLAIGGLGTPVFAAPEQLEDANAADERSDIYSLGRLLYFMLLERSPGYQIEQDPHLSNLAGYPEAIISIVRKATQWSPGRRYYSVGDLIRELQIYETPHARSRARVRRWLWWIKRNRAVLGVAGALVLSSSIVAMREREFARSYYDFSIKYENLATKLSLLNTDIKNLVTRRDELVRARDELKLRIEELNQGKISAKARKKDTERERRERITQARQELLQYEQQISEINNRLQLAFGKAREVETDLAQVQRDTRIMVREVAPVEGSSVDAGSDDTSGFTAQDLVVNKTIGEGSVVGMIPQEPFSGSGSRTSDVEVKSLDNDSRASGEDKKTEESIAKKPSLPRPAYPPPPSFHAFKIETCRADAAKKDRILNRNFERSPHVRCGDYSVAKSQMWEDLFWCAVRQKKDIRVAYVVNHASEFVSNSVWATVSIGCMLPPLTYDLLQRKQIAPLAEKEMLYLFINAGERDEALWRWAKEAHDP